MSASAEDMEQLHRCFMCLFAALQLDGLRSESNKARISFPIWRCNLTQAQEHVVKSSPHKDLFKYGLYALEGDDS